MFQITKEFSIGKHNINCLQFQLMQRSLVLSQFSQQPLLDSYLLNYRVTVPCITIHMEFIRRSWIYTNSNKPFYWSSYLNTIWNIWNLPQVQEEEHEVPALFNSHLIFNDTEIKTDAITIMGQHCYANDQLKPSY